MNLQEVIRDGLRLKTKNPYFTIKEAENGEPQLQNKRG
jgi:hypothetical protein